MGSIKQYSNVYCSVGSFPGHGLEGFPLLRFQSPQPFALDRKMPDTICLAHVHEWQNHHILPEQQREIVGILALGRGETRRKRRKREENVKKSAPCSGCTAPQIPAAKFIIFDTQFLGFDTQFLIFDTQFLVCDTQFLDFITTLHILVPSPQPVLVSFGSVCSTINTSDV